MDLFEDRGAIFSDCRTCRYALWRIWNAELPFVMYIGLNPSKANEVDNDNTITKVRKISENNGYGGLYMVNCFPHISTDPNGIVIDRDFIEINDRHLKEISEKCKTVVFAWGSKDIIKDEGRDLKMIEMFPNAKALFINKDGSPKHPLYCKDNSKFINFNQKN